MARRQHGCVRFSWIPLTSRTPRRYHCQPDLAIAAAGPAAAAQQLEAARVTPVYTATDYGAPAFYQLHRMCAPEIARGADDAAEMGAYHDLFQPQREDGLLAAAERAHPGRKPGRHPVRELTQLCTYPRSTLTMYADISRDSYRPDQNYSALVAQQGRALLDADANEQADLLLGALRRFIADVIGPAAGPAPWTCSASASATATSSSWAASTTSTGSRSRPARPAIRSRSEQLQPAVRLSRSQQGSASHHAVLRRLSARVRTAGHLGRRSRHPRSGPRRPGARHRGAPAGRLATARDRAVPRWRRSDAGDVRRPVAVVHGLAAAALPPDGRSRGAADHSGPVRGVARRQLPRLREPAVPGRGAQLPGHEQ